MNKTTELLKNLKGRELEFKTPITADMFLPNHSGIGSHPEAKKEFIKTDGTSITTSPIPFAEGISLASTERASFGGGAIPSYIVSSTNANLTIYADNQATIEADTIALAGGIDFQAEGANINFAQEQTLIFQCEDNNTNDGYIRHIGGVVPAYLEISAGAGNKTKFMEDVVLSGNMRFDDSVECQFGTGGGVSFSIPDFEIVYASGVLSISANSGTGVSATSIVINELSKDCDFRVEGNGDANLIFCDAGNDRVGIGMNNPAYKFDVTGDANVSGVYRVGGTAGISVTITTAALTALGSQGSMTFVGGILTAQTQAT